MATFRSQHIRPNTIAMVPIHGYVSNTKYSVDAIIWLDFLAAKEGILIQHALNGNGEKRIGGISVDGYCEQNNTIYQYQVRKTVILHVFYKKLHFLLCLSFYKKLNICFLLFRAAFTTDAPSVMTGMPFTR